MAYQVWSFSSMSGSDIIYYASKDSSIENNEGWYALATAKTLITKKDYIAENIITFTTKKEANKLLRILKKDTKQFMNAASWELVKV